MKNRYIITRVECPLKNDIDAQFVCFPEDNECSGCRYGDTKEQLIKKIQQPLFKRFITTITRPKSRKTIILAKSLTYKIAKEIVEFLGIEE